MNAAEVMAAIRDAIDSNVPGLEGVSYPALNNVPSSPWAMIRQSRSQPTIYEKDPGRQIVHLNVEVVLLVVSNEEQPREEAKLDTLIEPILDLFDANAVAGNNINSRFPTLPEPIDRIWLNAPVVRQPVKWGDSGFCYGAFITLDTQFKRHAVALP